MFLGHYGLALGAKKIAPKVSIGTFALASLLIDLIWPVLLLLDVEEVVIKPGITVVSPFDFTNYPYTHSLLAVTIWAVLFAVIFFVWRRSSKASILLGGLVLSHWLLDFLVHRPDLALLPRESTRVGIGLWNSLGATLMLEFGIFIAGLFIYWNSTHSRNRQGRYLIWVTSLLLISIYLASVFGPPPPDARMIGVGGLGQWLFVGLFYWIDRNRKAYVQ